MREIKFRVWDEEEGVMVSPDSIARDGTAMWKCHGAWSTSKNLEQYTGLKDKNGVEIYEGDILVKDKYPYFDDGVRNYVAVVEWVYAGFQYVLQCVNSKKRGISHGVNEYLEDAVGFEVIGNIHENPDLLP